MANKVEGLKKINLMLSLQTASQDEQPLAPPIPMEFIFGLGVQGLTFFECLLNGKAVGEEMTFDIEKDRLRSIFGHICIDLSGVANTLPDLLSVKASVLKVAGVSSQEVIKSMASQTGCGNGCDCGCLKFAGLPG